MSKTENLIVNNLVYSVPPSSTAAIERSYKRGYFDNRSYAEERTMRCVVQTGAQYVNCATSSLVIKVKPVHDGTSVNWGVGSAANLIKNVRVFSKSGVELSNILNTNLNRVCEDYATEDLDWFTSVGALMGYDSSPGADHDMPTSATTYEFVIPLCKVSPVFAPLGEQLMPASLASGLILEIDLESATKAFKLEGAGAVASSYTIEDIYLNLDNTTLNDMTVMTLNDITAKQLLEWSYVDVYNSNLTHNEGSSLLSTSINKSVSFADHIVAAIQNQTTADKAADNFIIPWTSSAGKYQYSLGSVQLPSNVMIDSLKQSYFQALSTYDRLRDTGKSAGYLPLAAYEGIVATKTTSFSKDQQLALSQLPISSARSLRLNVEYTSPPPSNQVVNVYLHYVKVAEVSLTDCKINY
tara:strand:- start:1418 stop:2650 length:1233 start_codon:yes stop_codon:yes gene_type:complete